MLLLSRSHGGWGRPHLHPRPLRAVVDGDIVNLDISVFTADGFHADLNESFLVGPAAVADEKAARLVKCAYECLRAAVSVCRPGVMYRDLGAVSECPHAAPPIRVRLSLHRRLLRHPRCAVSKVVSEAGFSTVKSYCGHGIGRMFHCAPNVPHYAKNKAVGMMKKG